MTGLRVCTNARRRRFAEPRHRAGAQALGETVSPRRPLLDAVPERGACSVSASAALAASSQVYADLDREVQRVRVGRLGLMEQPREIERVAGPQHEVVAGLAVRHQRALRDRQAEQLEERVVEPRFSPATWSTRTSCVSQDLDREALGEPRGRVRVRPHRVAEGLLEQPARRQRGCQFTWGAPGGRSSRRPATSRTRGTFAVFGEGRPP